MPLSPLLNNKGPLLVTKVRGGLGVFPEEFVGGLGKDLYIQEVPLDIKPTVLTDFLLESKLEQERTNERKRTDTYFGETGPGGSNTQTIDELLSTLLVSKLVLPDGQVGTRTRSLVREGTNIVANSLTVDGQQRNLGNGWLDQVITVKPTVFAKRLRSTELPDLVPIEFRAFLKTHKSEDTLAGVIADPPVLGANEFVRTEAEEDVFTFRRSTTSRDAVTLPFTISGNKKTNRYKQVETITHTLESDTTTPALPTSTRDVTFTKLGNGLAVEEWLDIPVIFDATVSAIEVPNIIPIEFRSNVPIQTLEQTAAGTVTIPQILGSGELSRSEEQIDKYNFRRKITTLGTVTFPQTLTGHEVSSEFGGGILDVLQRIDNADITPSAGLYFVSSNTKQIAPTLWYNETRYLPAANQPWPTLTNLKFDPEIQGYIKEETQIVDPGYALLSGTYFIENLKAIDKWKSQRIRITKQPSATGVGNAVLTYEYRPFQFPGLFDYQRLLTLDHREGYRRVSAMLCKHWIRTWWVTGALPSVAVDEIILDTVNIPIFAEGNTTGAQEYPNVLHDEFTNSLGGYYPATTPTFEAYRYGTPSSTSTVSYLSLSGPGSGYSVGNVVSFSGVSATVLVVAAGGAIAALSVPTITGRPIGSTVVGTGALTGGSGTGGAASRVDITIQNYTPGTAWIGQEKVVSAKVEKTEVPNLWKVTTESVVMR